MKKVLLLIIAVLILGCGKRYHYTFTSELAIGRVRKAFQARMVNGRPLIRIEFKGKWYRHSLWNMEGTENNGSFEEFQKYKNYIKYDFYSNYKSYRVMAQDRSLSFYIHTLNKHFDDWEGKMIFYSEVGQWKNWDDKGKRINHHRFIEVIGSDLILAR